MATELECTASGQNGSNFLDTFQLVESLEDRPPVPNHLLDTKIFRKTGHESKTVLADPVDIHFQIVTLQKRCLKFLSLMNITPRLISIQILPPQTKYFKIHYEKSGHLGPGTQMSCEVEFVPTEWRYYYDCIRIHCPEEENVIVPIHAYPVMKNDSLPENYTFPPTAIGEKQEKTFNLSSGVPVDFEFKLEYLQSNPAFTVSPMEGSIPGNDRVTFKVTFAPIRFETSIIKLQLSISQFNSKPQFCTLCGSSVPGLEMEKALKKFNEENPAILDPHRVAPLDRSRIKKNKTETSVEKDSEEIEYNGYRFPAQMNTVHAVSKVLNQKPNKLCTKDLRNILWKGKHNENESRQVKAVTFENSIQQLIKEERQNQLRWQKKVGDDAMSAESKIMEQDYWKQIWENYKSRFNHDPRNYRLETEIIYRRTMRIYDEIPEDVADFNPYKNNLWPQRLYVKRRFIQAVHMVIMQNRYSKRLKILKDIVEKWKPQTSIPDSIDDFQLREKFREDIEKNYNIIFEDIASKICSQSFMHTNQPGEKIQLYDSFTKVPLRHTEFIARKTVSYEDLLVPQYYRLQDYEPCDIHEAAFSYLYPDPEAYMLITERNQPQKELSLPTEKTQGYREVPKITRDVQETTPVVAIDSSFKYRKKSRSPKKKHPETHDKPDFAKRLSPGRIDNNVIDENLMKFKMPDFMLHHLKNSADHVFNPISNLLTFEVPLSYSEFHADYHVCPVPRFSKQNSLTQKKFLDKNDVIRGLMTWKQMPSPTLSALISNPTLKEFRLPKHSEHLSIKPPPLLREMPEEMKELAASGLTNPLQMRCNVNITPDIVGENFILTSEDQYTECRSYMENDLNKRIQNEKNFVGKKIRERISNLLGLLSEDTLIFS